MSNRAYLETFHLRHLANVNLKFWKFKQNEFLICCLTAFESESEEYLVTRFLCFHSL